MATLPRSSNTPTAARTPRPELRRHLSFATRAPPSPAFHLSQELRRHPSVTTRDPPFSEVHLRQRFVVTCRHLSFATRAPPSSDSTFHLSSTSVFRDYFIRCLSPSSHYQRQGNLFFWPLPPAPASSPPSTPKIWEIFHRLLQPCTDGPCALNRY